ncbi:MAG: uncharacterized protein KVP18_004204 [Porospora cf. gigantea A]|uniref:uncharacterized protein n=1 Tax=Porospora cf. gigantea A TaxID=2853593 RepID=UPI00355A1059|nr:MAG: hypothetical protein KVP18_004204 [Porospora cf. gigantea A]
MEVRRSVGKLRQLYRRAHVTDCILRQGNDGFVGFLLDSVTKSRRLCWTADPYLQLVATEVDETPTTDHATAKELIRKFRRQEGAPDDEFKIPESIFVKFWTNNRRYPCPDEVPLQDVRLVRLEPCSFTVLLPQSVAQELFSGRSLLRLRKRRLVPEVDSESHGYDTRRIRHALRTRYQ